MSTVATVGAAAYIVLLAGAILGLLRALTAAFSSQVRASIARHPVVHAMWFIIALVVLYDLLSTLCPSRGQQPLPNHPASGHAAYTPGLTIETLCRGVPEPAR
jgi:hypothetical protein